MQPTVCSWLSRLPSGFLAIRSPLWLDETISYWQIHAGFSQIFSRRGDVVPAYPYVLWLASKLFGTSEIALRFPSVCAMLAAVYLLYRAALELFDREIAFVTALIFCVHPIVIFAAIDARPYAFGVLTITSAIWILLRLRRTPSLWLAALLGINAALMLYFHFLFITLLPALAICLVALSMQSRPALLRKLAAALAAFAIATVPIIPVARYMVRTSSVHVFDQAPTLADLAWTIAPASLLFILVVAGLISAAIAGRLDLQSSVGGPSLLICLSLALIPLLILYLVSIATPIHIFVPRYRIVAIPGIALCWGLLISRINSSAIRMTICLLLITTTAYFYCTLPALRHHAETWEYALAAVEKRASPGNSPVLICSDLPESDYMKLPTGQEVIDSALFAPLTYYAVSGPVVPLPRSLNQQAMQGALNFLQHEGRDARFYAIAYKPSYGTVAWLGRVTAASHEHHVLAQRDGVEVVEFLPRAKSHF